MAKTRAKRAPPAKAKPAKKVFESDAAPRCRSRILVEVHVAGRVESAAITDLSASGARLVGAPLRVARGTPLEIRYRAFAGAAPRPLRAEYIRATDDGFGAHPEARRRVAGEDVARPRGRGRGPPLDTAGSHRGSAPPPRPERSPIQRNGRSRHPLDCAGPLQASARSEHPERAELIAGRRRETSREERSGARGPGRARARDRAGNEAQSLSPLGRSKLARSK
jgi:hypothetical protein